MSVSSLHFSSPEAAVQHLALEIAELVRSNDARDRPTVLGLATGGSPLPLYRELIRLHQQGTLSFRRVCSFNLDEYAGLPPEDPRSYSAFMRHHLFSQVDIRPENVHVPCGNCPNEEIPAHCADYEEQIRDAGGIDFQILGIGRTGHIGFNEPGSPVDSRTRLVRLDPATRADAADAFGGISNVPTHAITVGCGTILEARRIALLAWGERKAAIVAEALHGPVTGDLPASFLQLHPATTFYLDSGAASAVKRLSLPASATAGRESSDDTPAASSPGDS